MRTRASSNALIHSFTMHAVTTTVTSHSGTEFPLIRGGRDCTAPPRADKTRQLAALAASPAGPRARASALASKSPTPSPSAQCWPSPERAAASPSLPHFHPHAHPIQPWHRRGPLSTVDFATGMAAVAAAVGLWSRRRHPPTAAPRPPPPPPTPPLSGQTGPRAIHDTPSRRAR